MLEDKPRYEFRVWAANLAELKEQLERRVTSGQSRQTTSKETYMVSAATDRCNAKLRCALLDVKMLIAGDRGLEQWQPVLRAGFPLEGSVIATEVFPRLGVQVPHLLRARYSMDELVNEVVRPQAAITVAELSKSRLRFTLDPCRAEFASVIVSDAALQTVAVESTDPDAVLRLVRDLHLDGEPNISYVRQIKRILGL